MAKKRIPNLRDRFWDRVSRGATDECWDWRGSTKNGYGRFCFMYVERYAHRMAYELAFCRSIPDTMQVMHCCNNKRCCNPHHLQIGTPAENTAAAFRDGLIPSGSRHHKAKFADAFIERVANDPRPQPVISADLGISQSHVSRIKSGQTRRHSHG